ncbi:hypothetical protein QQN17_000651 [Escherichia coli]|nr:hypothetical protein [Escherichia coli]ELM8655561.1 hypothetical protein [Escherichia coli]ELM8765149.1 hypothetical protein [Escherichia coli]ELR4874490.1 hypothetical protein [Escherichia coli]
MAVNTTGDQNRAAGRDFNENKIQIDRFDGRHTINIAIPSEQKDEKPLVKAQRIELNRLVAAIVDTSGNGEAYEIWQKLHAEIGVSSIDDMTVNQYHTAVSFLQALLARLQESDNCRVMIHLLLKNTEDSDIRQKLLRYCHFNFGTGRLNHLTLSQLQEASRWLDEQKTQLAVTSDAHSSTKLSMLFASYPKLTILVVFAAGVLLGAVLFK